MVDTSSSGFSIQPFKTFGQAHTTSTYYDDVRVPGSMLVGKVNEGWMLITNQLNHERVSLFAAGRLIQLVKTAISWAQNTQTAQGRRVIDQEWVQIKLAECRALVRHLDLLNWHVAHETSHTKLSPADAAAIKVHGSESMHRIYTLLTEVIGATGHLVEGSPGSELASELEAGYRSVWVLTFGGGTNEIQRDIIGTAGLGLPREKRRH